MKTINPKIKVVLDRIQESIPQYLKDNVLVKKKLSPEVIDLLEKGVKDEEFSKEAREKWQLILDSGYLDKEVEQEVPEIAAEMNAYVELELAKAVIRKEIPKLKNKFDYATLYNNYQTLKQQNDEKFGRTS